MPPLGVVQQDDVGGFLGHQAVHRLRLLARLLGADLRGDVVADAEDRDDAAVLADFDFALRVDDLRRDVRDRAHGCDRRRASGS